MIYSKFRTNLTLVSKSQSPGGRISVQALIDGTEDTREYAVTDLVADDGLREIEAAIQALPWKTAIVTGRRQKAL